MAGDWIKMRTALPTCPKVAVICRITKLDGFAVVGRLHALWSWADEHTADGAAPGIDAAYLDGIVRRKGFAQALTHEHVGWLQITTEGVVFPDYEKHNGATGKRRAMEAKRKGEARKRPPSVRDVSASNADNMRNRGEERRGEKRRDLPPSVLPPAQQTNPPPTPPPKEGAAQPRSEGMDGRRAALADADIGGRWADALLESDVTEREIRDETKRAKASRNVRNVAAVVANSLARRHGLTLPGKKLRLSEGESDFLDTVHRRRA